MAKPTSSPHSLEPEVSTVDQQMAVARKVMVRRRKALRELAEIMPVAERIMREDYDLLARLAKYEDEIGGESD